MYFGLLNIHNRGSITFVGVFIFESLILIESNSTYIILFSVSMKYKCTLCLMEEIIQKCDLSLRSFKLFFILNKINVFTTLNVMKYNAGKFAIIINCGKKLIRDRKLNQ